jgi:hypothetical protein
MDLLTLQGYLLEAQLALHKLLTGTKETSVSYEGKSVTFSAANVDQLKAYIADLERQIAVILGTAARGPIVMRF